MEKTFTSVTGWFNIYPNGVCSRLYKTQVDADLQARHGRIACVFDRIVFFVGQNLEDENVKEEINQES